MAIFLDSIVFDEARQEVQRGFSLAKNDYDDYGQISRNACFFEGQIQLIQFNETKGIVEDSRPFYIPYIPFMLRSQRPVLVYKDAIALHCHLRFHKYPQRYMVETCWVQTPWPGIECPILGL